MNKTELQNLKEILKNAFEFVKELQLPEPFQPIAFEIVLKALIREEREGIPTKEQLFYREQERKKIEKKKEGGKVEEVLAQKLDIKEPKLLCSVYEFYPAGEIGISVKLEGKNSEIQRKTAYLYLLPGQLLPNQEEWISSLKLSEQIKVQGKHVLDGHTAHNLEKEKGKILSRGRGKGKKYSLSSSGVKEAKNILKEILGDN